MKIFLDFDIDITKNTSMKADGRSSSIVPKSFENLFRMRPGRVHLAFLHNAQGRLRINKIVLREACFSILDALSK